jgi:hypothetical protein
VWRPANKSTSPSRRGGRPGPPPGRYSALTKPAALVGRIESLLGQ